MNVMNTADAGALGTAGAAPMAAVMTGSGATVKKERKHRTPIAERDLVPYTKGEEICNMVTHIVGAVLAVAVLVLCVVKAASHGNVWGVVTGAVFGASMLLVYVISSVYHGLSPEGAGYAKRVMQVLDHCDIYGLILGTYTPVALVGLREVHPVIAWVSWGIVAGVGLLGMVFTAIDYKMFMGLSYSTYFVSGWSVILSSYFLYQAYGLPLILWLVIGGAVYSLGMITFVLQQKHKYCHSIFHLFILGGSILHFVGIYLYCM